MDSHSLYPKEKSQIDSICIGSGRFLRAVLVPALVAANLKPIIVQTRGTSFMKYCSSRKSNNKKNKNNEDDDTLTYEVDTVLHNGEIKTDIVLCYGAGTLGTDEGKKDTIELLDGIQCIKLIGVGVTEAGLASASSQSMRDLFDILSRLHDLMTVGKIICNNPHGKISIVNTDNVPHNGDTIRRHMMTLANDESEKGQQMLEFLDEYVVFHNSMVDRITSQRPGSDGDVPRAEPTPAKALVIEDLGGDLPLGLLVKDIQDTHGVVIRFKKGELNADIALKLRVANGTHTAVAHTMALCGLLMTDVLSSPKGSIHYDSATLLMKYLDELFQHQICTGVDVTESLSATAFDAKYVYQDWRQRLVHAHFGLSTFFITQNGASKGGIRIGPTMIDLVNHGKPISSCTVFALAAILRFLTPAAQVPCKKGIYRGWMDGTTRSSVKTDDCERSDVTKIYADGLSYNLDEGWYEFRCDCNVHVPNIFGQERPLPEVLGSFAKVYQPTYYYPVVRDYLIRKNGGDLSILADQPQTKDIFTSIVKAVSSVYARMVAGDGMLDILKSLIHHQSCDILIDGHHPRSLDDHQPLHYKQSFIPDDSKLMEATIGNDREAITNVVFSEVASVEAVDLHTHLLPPSHGALCLWGIDELLTYHYLVAEYFMTAPSDVSPDSFYSLTKREQANIIWKALFVDRTPLSEACRGVITTLVSLGLEKDLHARDLDSIRKFLRNYRDDGIEGAERYCSFVFQKAGIRYAVMTNIPFDSTESQHWKPKPKEYSHNFRSACRVDPLLAGDRQTIENALLASGYDRTIEGARKYLHDWCDVMKPEYMMASTPHNFVLQEDLHVPLKKGRFAVNEDALNQPFAFTDILSSNCDTKCDGGEDELASVIDENSDFLSEVLMKVCEERDLPIALKIGAHRNLNPRLRQAGDGVVAFADANMLARLCIRFPKVRFLATFLSRNNQHEACVLATKFRNLHIYGCWWFCNNPSIIEEITKMRVEMLGTAFTAQHSDSRVVDQLLYKWAHSRAVIAKVMTKEYIKLSESGWIFTREEIRRDIRKLFGKSYEEFMDKTLAN